MLPLNTASSVDVAGDLTFPDDQVVSPLQDYELGGVAIGDPSRGLTFQPWRSHVDSLGRVRLQPMNAAPTIVHTEPGITELSFAFDQNMRPALGYVVAGLVRLRWYDSTVSNYVITDFPGLRSPRLSLDEKRPMLFGAISDVIFAYIRDSDLCYRQQRDRYLTEYVLRGGVMSNQRIVSMGMNNSQRLQIEVA